ncbi:SAND family protein [Zea mays]|uniref:Vacuolar fusion protein MON1 homolog n=1 Tax=Zea mays TaxID=4577 RepID=A0A1D6MZZ2_MAIZE|nr:SAND family protein [Zea mays]
MDPPNPNPNDAPSLPAESAARLAALSLCGTRDLPPDFHTAEILDDDEGYLTSASRGGSSTSAWKEAPEGLHDDDKDGDDVSQPSPRSSGYAGERGSSLDDDADPDPDPDQDWARGKKHPHEDDASSSWRKRKKHFFILSNSGKPIYSRYGDEHKLAGFSATLQAIISFVENSGDHIKFVRAGKHQIVFLVKGPIYLVCISCTEESYEGLRGQLELMYGQLLLILTKSVNKCFEKNPRFDMATLLGGTDAVFLSLIHAFSWNPATFLHAYTCLPLAQSTRQAASAVLQDIADSGVLFALLMCEHKEHTYVTLLTTRSDAFYDLKDSRAHIQNALLKSNVLIEVQRSLHENALRVEDLPTNPSSQSASHPPESSQDISSQSLSSEMAIGGPGGLWHFIYKSIYLDQFVSSEFPSPISNKKQKKGLYKAYQKLYASMHDKATGPHKTQFRRDEDYVLFCWITQDFELYAAFNPLADKTQAIKMCNRVCQWVRDLENEIFVYGESTLSW